MQFERASKGIFLAQSLNQPSASYRGMGGIESFRLSFW
jgi:hypothetical protein